MEPYLRSWEGTGKEYQNLSQNKLKFGMKNSEADDDKVGACNEPCADSLPLHCIIQTFSSMRDLKSPPRCQHCDGHATAANCWWEPDCDNNEIRACIVVPEDTSMNDLVRTALVKLGYPPSASSFATGSILIRNWKPLPLEVVCPDMKKPVGDILGEITAVVSLRIQIFKPKITASQKMKDSLLLFLINASHGFLRESRCPFDVATLLKLCDHSSPVKMQFLQEPPEDLQRKFNSWLKDLQDGDKQEAGGKSQSFLSANSNKSPTSQYAEGEKRTGSPAAESISQERVKMAAEKENLVKEPLLGIAERPKHLTAPKTRVRTSFDPEFELPKLQKWFVKNPHPSRQQIYEYVAELNSLESRKGRKQLDVNNVVYWFKNARAAQKRTECRRFSNTPTTETNRCNVLRIPLGKNCGVMSDDQRSVSDDDASVTSESGDDYRQENGSRCLQVVGKWNSNGQGEAVLEMQIPSRKNGKRERTSEGEENLRNVHESGGEFPKEGSGWEKRELPTSEKSSEQQKEQKECKSGLPVEEKMGGVKLNDVTGNNNNNNHKNEDCIKMEVSPKVQIRTSFPSFKDSAPVNDSEFLSPYKPAFPVPTNSVLNSSFMCMSQYIGSKQASLPLSSEERRKRNRTFIDPVTEVPRLEQWFRLSTHPSHNLIARYTDELNSMPYRRKFPKLEAKNVQFWFKNRRAKNKRLNFLEANN